MNKIKILFFVPEVKSLDNGVLHSQVLAVARFLNTHGFSCAFVGAESDLGRAGSAGQMISDVFGVKSFIYDGFCSEKGLWSLRKTAQHAATAAERFIHAFNPTHVYARSLAGADTARTLAKRFGGIAVYDVRGVTAEEVALRRGSRLNVQYWLAELWLRRTVLKADRVSCVSHRLSDWIEAKYNRKPDTVIPCCVDSETFFYDPEQRGRTREELGFEDHHIVLCYSGGLTFKWQRAEEIFQLVGEILKQDEIFRFLVLTRENEYCEKLIRQNCIDAHRVSHLSSPQSKIARYLSCADCGIVYRDDIIVNNVASPIKIAEYLACGLPVLMTKGIGDYSEMLPSHGLAYIVDDKKDVSSSAENVIKLLCGFDMQKLKKQCVDFVAEHLSLSSHLSDYNDLYT